MLSCGDEYHEIRNLTNCINGDNPFSSKIFDLSSKMGSAKMGWGFFEARYSYF